MRMLTDNLAWKLFSLGLAFAVWLALSGETEVSTSVPVSVQFKNISPDLELNTDPIDRLFLKVRGPATRLTASSLARTALVLDLTSAVAPGEQTFTIGTNNLSLPPGVTLMRVVPAQVRVRLERRASKEVPVEVRFGGSPPPGYRVASQDVQPARVRVLGPESRLDQIGSVQTDPINLSSKLAKAEFRVPVFLQDPHVRFDQDNPMVTVRVTLEKKP
jgi:hypothetical protein